MKINGKVNGYIQEYIQVDAKVFSSSGFFGKFGPDSRTILSWRTILLANFSLDSFPFVFGTSDTSCFQFSTVKYNLCDMYDYKDYETNVNKGFK